ncbi:MAG: hypothetical protein A2176_15530 [Spirochaetes bacterium RBG_13_51_14]|nr:MAG: hypothetical protein A2176_15530 [Spirochaetes bacterium RBG_13_51_14]
MIQEKLSRFINNENRPDFRSYSLESVLMLLDRFGNPHRSLRMIHIAGTNGKGSVAHMLHDIFSHAGYAAGRYTSPHLLDINERIAIHDEHIQDGELERYIDDIIGLADSDRSLRPTYFDILTVCALRHFSDRRVDIAVIETGLGGRLDSTNVITPLVSVITDISMDHTHILGNTLEAITREKAGIIKNGVPVVTSNTSADVNEILASHARVRQADFYALGRDFTTENIVELENGFRYDYRLAGKPPQQIIGLEVSHPMGRQVANSSLAVTASIIARSYFQSLTDDAIREGMKNFNAPGRFQVLSRDPVVVVYDPAHNRAAMHEMAKLASKKFNLRNLTLVITLMKDKDIGGIMKVLEEHGMKGIYFILTDPRCHRPRPGDHPRVIKDIITADETELHRRLDRMIAQDTVFFFIGSFRLYGTAQHYAHHHRRS